MSRLLASLSAPPGPHPTTGELRDYAAGTLPAAAQHRVEAHALACPRCADALAGWQLSAPAPADAALARLRGRLRERVQALEPLAAAEPLPTVVPAAPGSGTAPWLGLRRWAAAAAVAGLSAVGLWAWQHREIAETNKVEVAALPPVAPATATAETDATADAAAKPSAEALLSKTAAPAAPNDVAAVRPVPPPPPFPPLASGRPARPRATASVMESVPPSARGDASYADAPAGDVAAAPAAEVVVVEAAPAPASPPFAYNSPSETSSKKLEDKSKELQGEPVVSDAEDKAGRAASVANAPVARAKLDRAATSKPTPAAPAAPTDAAASPAGGLASTTALPAPAPVAPAPVGGWLALRERLRRQAADFDPADGATRLTGTVRLRLLIGADGRVQESKVLRGLRADYDAEALRLATETAPRWQPGLANGRRTALPVEMVVSF